LIQTLLSAQKTGEHARIQSDAWVTFFPGKANWQTPNANLRNPLKRNNEATTSPGCTETR
jgi:hypothetical protein